ncbi:MAG TPA: hypothetical protein VII33_03530, partial [Nakamurella sp.]
MAPNDDNFDSLELDSFDTTGGSHAAATDTLEPIAGDEPDNAAPTRSAKTGRSLRKPVLVGVAALVLALVAGAGV